MASLLIGELAPDQPSFEPSKNKLLIEDFRELLSTVEKMGLFKRNQFFFFLILLHILLMDFAGWFILWYFGISKTSFFIATVLLTFAQSQAGFLQHDLGHLSVFSNPKWNHLWHEFVMCYLKEIAWTLAYFIRFFIAFNPIFGFKGVLGYLLLLNVLESIIFTWISQTNHLPMPIDYDKNMDWFSTQLQSTCNVNQSFFNDWVTGHLNFQIEHHLFPTMPRHNFWKVAPLVKSMCAKHGIEYQSKPLFTGFADIVHSLKVAGEIWFKAYHLEQKTQTPKICLQQGKKGEETR